MVTVSVDCGDCREILPLTADSSIDSVVTDPPYELGFMGKKWDASGTAYDLTVWKEIFRVLKPGGHLLAFGGTRTYHRMTCAIEDAGFEIRDSINWLYGSGFPKSLDVSNAIDKVAGAERAVSGSKRTNVGMKGGNWTAGSSSGFVDVTIPVSDDAKRWEGWGTALKPAHEPIVVARKPLVGTVVANVLTHGTGAMNIDGCRVPTTDRFGGGPKGSSGFVGGYESQGWVAGNELGRWPANVVLGEEVAEKHPEWATYFYCAKASRKERDRGLAGLEQKPIANKGNGLSRTCAICGTSTIPGCECPDRTFVNPNRANHHPTVKPLALMRWLVRLVTPPGGMVLDPFAGSGTTLLAAFLENRDGYGIELDVDYCRIARARISSAIETETRGMF